MEAKATPGGAVALWKLINAAPCPTVGFRKRTNHALLLTAVAAAVLSACGDEATVVGVLPEIVLPPTAAELLDAQILVVSGDAQEGEVATVLREPLVVEVSSSSGGPLGGAPVEWLFDAGHPPLVGGATVPSQRLVSVTDRNGRASTTWELGTAAGDQTVSVRVLTPAPSVVVSGAPSLASGRSRQTFSSRAKAGIPRTVTIVPAAATLSGGDSVKLSTQVEDRYGNVLQDQTIAWATSTPAIATVSQIGIARALSPGVVTITAATGRAKGTSTITVTATTSPTLIVKDQSYTVIQSLELVVGASVSLSATAIDSQGALLGTITPSWRSTNAATATVSSQGIVRALATGSTDVIASYEGATKTIRTTVTALPISPESGDVVFASDWSTALGNGGNALLDNAGELGSWDAQANLDDALNNVISIADSLRIRSPGFANCLALTPPSSGRVLHNSLPELAVGDSRNYRVYFAALYPSSSMPDNNWHPADIFTDGGSGDDWFHLFQITIPNNTSSWNAWFTATGNALSDDRMNLGGSRTGSGGPLINLGRKRFWGLEIRFRRTGATTAEVTHAWVYDDTGNEVYDSDDFELELGNTPLSERSWKITDPGMSFDNWRMGSNGFPDDNGSGATPDWSGDPWGCWGGVAVVDNVTQIGPWNGSY